MRLYKATILDIWKICEIAGPEYMLAVRNSICAENATWFLEEGKYTMCFEKMGNGRYQMHIYSKEEYRGKELKQWAIECGYCMFETTDAKELVNFVSRDRKDLRMLMASIGSRKVGVMPSGDIMYVSTADMEI